MSLPQSLQTKYSQRGTSILGGGGLGPHIKFRGKIWGKIQPSSPNKRKNLGSSVTTRRKSWEKILILGPYLKFKGQNLRYLSPIFLESKFGAPTRISEVNFGAKPPPPDLLIWKTLLGKCCCYGELYDEISCGNVRDLNINIKTVPKKNTCAWILNSSGFYAFSRNWIKVPQKSDELQTVHFYRRCTVLSTIL